MGFFSSIKTAFRRSAGAEQKEKPGAGSGDAAPLQEETRLLEELRAATPRLSSWLDILLAGVRESGPLLTRRLFFLFKALEVPEEEAVLFVEDFRLWLERMEYSRLEEFRSELQYRLALALDLEDEEDEKSRLLLKLSAGLAKTRAQLGQGLEALFQPGRILDARFWEDLEEALLLGDVGYEAALELSRRLRERAALEGARDPAALRLLLRSEIASLFCPSRRITAVNPPETILLTGVNGSGKTTTAAKLAYRYKLQGKRVLLAAADTFRAAAVEQLELWAGRAGADFYAGPAGADPASVAYTATEKALKERYDVLLVDTAGRLQTKTNLMEELAKIRRVMARLHPGAPHRSLLVLDANTGQNALSQAKLFNSAGGVNEIILTKMDGTAKGGVAVAIALLYRLPISYVGLGEKMEDLRPFDGENFAAALLGG
jgi:fused signal recognition particle receptor